MVFITAESQSDPPILPAYLHVPLHSHQRDLIHTAFEFGAHSRFPKPFYELLIHSRTDFYRKEPAEIRAILDGEGRGGYFLLLDEDSGRIFDEKDPQTKWASTAILVDRCVSDDEVNQGTAIPNPESGPRAVWKIRMALEDVSLALANYDIANIDIEEDLGNSGIDFPYDQNQPQPEPRRLGHDFHLEQDSRCDAYITALAGEYETTTDEDICRRAGLRAPGTSGPDGYRPAYRLTSEVAQGAGLKQRWAVAAKTGQERWTRLGQEGDVPEGTVNFVQYFDEASDKWKYERLPR